VRPWSLSARLGWRLAAVLSVAILLAAGAVAWRAIAAVHELDDLALQKQAALIAAELPLPDNTIPDTVTIPDALVRNFRSSDGDNIFLIYQAGRLVRMSDPPAAAQIIPLLRQNIPQGFFRLPATHGHHHGMVGLSTIEGPWQVVVLQGREQTAVLLDSLMQNFTVGAVALLLPIGLTTILVAVLTVRRGLRPLRQVSAAALMIGPALPGSRLPTTSLPDEVLPLVQTVNGALARLDQALTVQRLFMAEAAHALRTPLAVMTARLDMLEDRPDVAGLRHDADRMARLVQQLLGMARLESVDLDVSQSMKLHDVATEAITALAPLALHSDIALALVDHSGKVLIHGNHGALVLALTNLIENAIAHAPRGSDVEVVLNGPASVVVQDRGAGVAPELRSRIFERFVRGPGERDGGAGLGLAIVAEIAAAHHGSAHVEPMEGGGCAFVINLALAETVETTTWSGSRTTANDRHA
jgi:signal transduction histidine kinase